MEDNENINKDPDARKNSWVFIEKNTEANDSDSSASYYFKTDETNGVQELIEDDLGSNVSSCDSDGISVISETEYHLNDCCICLPKINTGDEDEADVINNDDSVSDQAVLNKENLEIECDINNVSDVTDNSDTSEYESVEINFNHNLCNNKLTLATTVAGVCIVITYLIANYNYDAPKSDEIDNFDEIYDMYMWKNYDNINDTCDYSIDNSKLNTINHLVQTYSEIKYSDLSLPVVMKPTRNTEEYKKTINKEKYANNPDKYNKKLKNKNSDNQQTLKLKENYLKKKDKYLTKKEKYLKKLEKHIINLEARFRKIFNRVKKDTIPHFEHSKVLKQKKNTTGDWYQKMSFGRSEIRQKEKLSDWMFDRSKMRSKLRDKAHWYFTRANGREEIRSGEKLRYAKRKYFKSYRY